MNRAIKKHVMILGAYGNFGRHISFALAKNNMKLILCGRSHKKLAGLAEKIKLKYPKAAIIIANIDVNKKLLSQLNNLNPEIVINTCGPFQNANYNIIEACIKNKIHYIDLADSREFVANIGKFDRAAKNSGIMVISGAAVLPGLSSAVIEHYKKQFHRIEELYFGISLGANIPRGLANIKAILSYVGKPLKPWAGSREKIYGWQDIYKQKYPIIGKRWMANCEVPDLDLLPQLYNIKSIHFSGGVEVPGIHFTLFLLSWLVRIGLPIKLAKYAKIFAKISSLFDCFGSSDGGMHMIIKGKDKQGNDKQVKWFLIAQNGSGLHIACVPSIILAKKLINGEIKNSGAVPCIGMLDLEEYMQELKNLDVKQIEEIA